MVHCASAFIAECLFEFPDKKPACRSPETRNRLPDYLPPLWTPLPHLQSLLLSRTTDAQTPDNVADTRILASGYSTAGRGLMNIQSQCVG